MRKQAGFVLIELMLVVAIIGILASVSLAAYQQYTIRARVVESLTFLTMAKSTVAENLVLSNGTSLNNCEGVNLVQIDSSTENIESSACDNLSGALAVTTTPKAGGIDIVLTPIFTSSNVTWVCEVNDLENYSLVPAECRN